MDGNVQCIKALHSILKAYSREYNAKLIQNIHTHFNDRSFDQFLL